MKQVILTISFVICLLVILPIILALAIKNIPGDVQPSLKDTKKIYGPYVYSQSFISTQDNLVGIGVSLKNPQLVNKNATYFNLYDDSNILIRKVTLRGGSIGDGQFVKILFDPVAGTLNKKFTWSVASPDSTKDDGLEVFLTDTKPRWSKELKVNNQTSEDSFSYVSLYKPTGLMEVLKIVLTDLAFKLKGDLIFSVFLAILSFALLGYLLLF